MVHPEKICAIETGPKYLNHLVLLQDKIHDDK